MKIDHSNEFLPLIGPGAEKGKIGRLEKTNDFASVLKETAQNQQTDKLPVNTPGRTSQTLSPRMDMNQKEGYEKTASLLIDTLEKYQKILADPKANLMQMQPVVDQMRIAAGKTGHWIGKLPDDHALQGVIKEALIQMNKEITRFDRGEYID